jgi:hypothetical protein
MKSSFEKLPKRYQRAINDAIREADGEDGTWIAEVFRSYEAKGLSELLLTAENLKDINFGIEYLAFKAGWQASEIWMDKNMSVSESERRLSRRCK